MKVTKIELRDGIQAAKHRKENHFIEEYALIAYQYKGFYVPVILRLYGTQRMNYACLWIRSLRSIQS